MKRSSIVICTGLVLLWVPDKGFWTLQRNGTKCWIYPDGKWTIECDVSGHRHVSKFGIHLSVDAATDGLFKGLLDTNLFDVLVADAQVEVDNSVTTGGDQ